MQKIKDMNKYFKATVLILGLLTVVRLILAGFIGLDGGPAYYAMWSRHLEMSYFDHPMMVAVMVRVSTTLFGWNSFAIKLPAVLVYLATSIFMYKTIKLWGGKDKGAFYAVMFFNFIPWIAESFGIKAGNPDIPFLFCWLMAFYYFSKLYKTENPNNWYFIGLWTAIGLLSKYKMVFVYPALLLCMLGMPKLKSQWKKPQLYISGFFALVGIVPTVIWNINNDFASFSYHLVERQGSFGFKPMQLLKFLGNQIAIMGVFIPVLLFINAYKHKSSEVGKAVIFFIAPAVVVFSFANLCFGQSMQNWWASVYMTLLVLYGVKRAINKYDKWILIFTATVTIIGNAFYIYPFGVKLKESTNFLDHHLFDKAAEHLKNIIKEREAKGETVYVGTPRYRTTAMLGVNMPEQKIYSMDYRKGDQFQIWYNPAELIGKNVIYVAGGSQVKQKPENIFNADEIILFDVQKYVYNPAFSRSFYFYELKNYKGLK